MQVKTEELNPCTVQLNVTVEQPQVQEAFNRAIKELSKNLRIPGFRPGAAPRAMAERYLDPARVQQRAAEIAVSKAYQEAIAQTELTPYGQPSVNLEQIAEDADLIFTVKVPLAPKIELGDYKGYQVNKPVAGVSEEEVNAYIEELRSKRAKFTKVEGRAAATGDHAVVALEPQEGDDTKGRKFLVQVGETFGALDQLLSGMKPEETKTATLTFPSDFQETAWAGVPMDVKVTLESLQAVEVPELNETFAKEFGVESVDELRDKVREDITAYQAHAIDEHLRDQVIGELLNKASIHLPDTMWEARADEEVESVEEQVVKEGGSVEEAAAAQNLTVEQFRENIREDVKKQFQIMVALQEIAKVEEMKLAPEELAEQIGVLARQQGVSMDTMRQQIERTKNWDPVIARALYKKVTDFLLENAQVTEVNQ